MNNNQSSDELTLQFSESRDLLSAVRKLVEKGIFDFEAYSPHKLPEFDEIMQLKKDRAVPIMAALGGVLGGLGGYFLQLYAAVLSYPHNIGGRPFHSTPAFMPVIFEMTVLLGAFFALGTMFIKIRLPSLHQKVFEKEEMRRVTQEGYLLILKSKAAIEAALREQG